MTSNWACVRNAAGVLACSLLAAPTSARAQATHDSVVVSILTMGPGAEIFERFGHQSIRYHNLTTGLDSAYNWGMYDFAQPHFLVNFLTGETKYWMAAAPSPWLIYGYYKEQKRAVWEQELLLTRTEKDSLWRFLQWNSREENKYYRYDYYRDNCATKVRDVINMIVGGSLEPAITGLKHGVSYRSETLRLAREYPLINFGMDFVLGRPADSTLSASQEMFVPMRLQQLIAGIEVTHNDGTKGRLVLSERQLVVDDTYADAAAPPNYFMPALAVGLGIAALVLVLVLGMLPDRPAAARAAIGIIGTMWHLLAGAVGLLLLYAELFTRHAAYMGHNVNVLLATPASMALVVIFPLALRGATSAKLVRAARALSMFTAVCAIITVFLRMVPFFAQTNPPLLALAIPVHSALAFALWRATNAANATHKTNKTAPPGETV